VVSEKDKTMMPLRQAVMAAARAAGQKELEGMADEEGLVAYLKNQALNVPGSFLTLLGKVATQDESEDSLKIMRIELVAPEIKINENEDG